MMRPPTTRKLPGGATAAKPKPAGPPADAHTADPTIRVAYLPDPVKVRKKANYPTSSVRDRLQEVGMQFTTITVRDVHGGKLSTDAYDVICLPGGFAPNFEEKLGAKGQAAIEAFLASGGGFVGVGGRALRSVWCIASTLVPMLLQSGAAASTDVVRHYGQQ